MGRFLKKCDDGLWRDVGDKVAAEKTSQGTTRHSAFDRRHRNRNLRLSEQGSQFYPFVTFLFLKNCTLSVFLGLRERSNAEKRRRSIERRQGEKATTESGTPASKRSKKTSNDPTSEYLNGPIPDFGTAIPLSLSMKPIGVTGSELKDEEVDESLPPLAKDKDGKILVTKYDVLFGRGGLTNHHKVRLDRTMYRFRFLSFCHLYNRLMLKIVYLLLCRVTKHSVTMSTFIVPLTYSRQRCKNQQWLV